MDTALDMRGHNRPPVTEIFRQENEQLQTNLMFDNQDLLERRDELLAAMARCPLTCDDDAADKKFTDFKAQLVACIKSAETKRVSDKDPIIQSGKLVDGFYKQIIDPLNEAKDAVLGRLTTYKLRKEAEERRIREAAELAARKEAERLAKEAAAQAANLNTEQDLAAALATEERSAIATADAYRAQEAANANAAELSRTRSDSGSVSSLVTRWKGVLESRDTLDLEALRVYLSEEHLRVAINKFIAVHKGSKPLRGVKIYEDKQAR